MQNNQSAPPRSAPERFSPEPDCGLTAAQVKERTLAGLVNAPVDAPTKSVAQIIRDNSLTYFNMVFVILALCVCAVGAWRDLTFMPVIFINSLIGIVQEIRSKRTLDKLNLISEPKSDVIRDSNTLTIPSAELVLDDVVIFSAGSQICADALILDGDVQVNEALITGEADEISKSSGDELLSGSFIVSGKCRARLEHVGADSFASKLTIEAKRSKKLRQSEMMRSLTRLVQVISIIIIPVAVALFYNQHFILGLQLNHSVVTTVAALVGMIPEGLYLLTSLALTLGVLRLARKRTLVHELGCIETLARVNVLCVDKTGTITEPGMLVHDVIPLEPDRFLLQDIESIMADHAFNLGIENDTMKAISNFFNRKSSRRASRILPFTSSAKFSCAVYNDETYLLGAPESILGDCFHHFSSSIDPFSQQGFRVLLLAMYDGTPSDYSLDYSKVSPIALILLSNIVRENAPDTFRFFAQQGVSIKVISGDNPLTVSNIAKAAAIENADLFVDASTLNTEAKLKAAAKKYTVFGRVTPEQKRKLIRALKAAGNTVAMTGDGVNDVLALKDADCSIAMASGSDVACQVSQIVLLNSDFSAMPDVVMEGRRVINNIQRSAALFLVKNIFSFTFAIISMLALLPYPVSSGQLSMVSMITIGLPSFLLTLEPNTAIVSGHFLRNVLLRALPGGLTDVIIVLAVTAFALSFNIPDAQRSTLCAILLSIVGFSVLFHVCRPFTLLRKALVVIVAAAILFSSTFLRWFFVLQPLEPPNLLILATLALLAYPILDFIFKSLNRLTLLIASINDRLFKNSRTVKNKNVRHSPD